jgi:hypothetical protein
MNSEISNISVEVDGKISRLITLSVQGSSLPLSTLVDYVVSNLEIAIQRLDADSLQSQGTYSIFCVHYLCFIGRVYVFYVGHVDKSSLYETLFHCNILSKHHQFQIPPRLKYGNHIKAPSMQPSRL